MSKLVRTIISTASAPKAIGPYSQAVQANNTLYISGQLGLQPESMQLADGVQAQTRQALKNMGAILKQAGATYRNVVKCTVLLADMEDFATVNDVYAEFFPPSESPPARAAYQVARLPKDGRVEIEAIAVLGELVDANL